MLDIQTRISALEMKYYCKILRISYRNKVSNIEVCRQTEDVGSLFKDLLTTVKRQKLQWYGHVTQSNGLTKTVLQGTVPGGRKCGCQHKKWINNVKEWIGLSTVKMNAVAIDRQKW